jgi:hypothetical protein
MKKKFSCVSLLFFIASLGFALDDLAILKSNDLTILENSSAGKDYADMINNSINSRILELKRNYPFVTEKDLSLSEFAELTGQNISNDSYILIVKESKMYNARILFVLTATQRKYYIFSRQKTDAAIKVEKLEGSGFAELQFEGTKKDENGKYDEFKSPDGIITYKAYENNEVNIEIIEKERFEEKFEELRKNYTEIMPYYDKDGQYIDFFETENNSGDSFIAEIKLYGRMMYVTVDEQTEKQSLYVVKSYLKDSGVGGWVNRYSKPSRISNYVEDPKGINERYIFK